ncbi:prepilin-type N-terminal cleavage/methylation domain-containing protein [Clostridium sp. CF012]|uniref:prepilin-type N-terminal cleavage/methylation domain-containing protein n=1 Tax=Clostridium sp. CF012 TaxID=2843319 RepID=UPI001C0DDA58|nr:prepilin-type N-terminal cleavage/methylation domain-containing protein [Clostridium sp. CF012]MBU3146316.1 prepilin-type N-terminal cleavage/methylation domain-containing protein [Clostridium sp. CF012]
MKKNVKRKKGFTLIEIIIVISIIVVLAAIAVPKYASIQKDAKVKADIASAKVIAEATTILIGKEEIEGTYKTAAAEVSTDIVKYLQSTPVVKAIEDGKFFVHIDADDNVTVTVVSTKLASTFTLYPTAKGYPTAKD